MTAISSTDLRRYSRFLYQHIHRYDYGYKRPGEGFIRIPKQKLLAARNAKSNRKLSRITEKHLRQHLQNETTYYYTGQRKTHFLLLCVDIDAHEGQEDAWDVANYLKFWWFKDCYMEASTNGAGVHLYIRLDLTDFPYISSRELHRLFFELGANIRQQVINEGYEADVCGIYGLPSDWVNESQAQIIKLPRPETVEQLNELLSLKTTSLEALRLLVVENERELAALHPMASASASDGSHLCLSLCTMIATPPAKIDPQTAILTQVNHLDLDNIRARNPLYRASWTVKTMANILNRTPTVDEALRFYHELQLGTGTETPQRVRRFTQAVEYNRERFDPNKRQSFARMLPALKIIMEKAIQSHPQVSLHYRSDRKAAVITLENLCVGYYFALYQLGRDPDGTLPKDGITSLNRRLLEAKAVTGPISNQKASAIRRILVALGILDLVDTKYTFGHGRGKAMKYRLSQNINLNGSQRTL